MIEWTPSAREELEDHLKRIGPSLNAAGADVGEVREDLRRHVDEEAALAGLGVVTAEEVGRILRQVGGPDPALNEEPAKRETVAREKSWPETQLPGRWSSVFIILFGVLLPAVTLVFELATAGCAGILFDPIPTWWHVALVAFVPVANILVYSFGQGTEIAPRGGLEFLNGLAIGVSLIYALLFLPIMPVAVIGTIFFGLGLLPLSPFLAFIAAVKSRAYIRRYDAVTGRVLRRRMAGGVILGMLLFAVGEVPETITRVGLEMAASDSPEQAQRGIRWLRRMGDTDVLLRACYERPGRPTDLVSFVLAWSDPVSPHKARTVFYRVTGRQFTDYQRPRIRNDFIRADFDLDQGGTEVGGRLRHVSLSESRIDGSIDGDAALAYMEWTLVFKNDGPGQAEARAEVALPPGAVVSRLTLWVDGEPREAAFAGRQQVREAYEKVAIRQRRDPVLVTTRGPDRVLMQCFPIPPNGGEMKVRMGITSPLHLVGASEAAVVLPRFVDRNFNIADEVRHSVWLESRTPVEMVTAGLSTEQPEERLYAVRGGLSDAELMAFAAAARVRRSSEVVEAWTADPLDPEGHVVIQRLTPAPADRPEALVLVVDSSAPMGAVMPAIAEALGSLPPGIALGLVVAADTPEVVSPLQNESHTPYALIAERLKGLSCRGGCDNAAALVVAWDMAAARGNARILWVHGPQPVKLGLVEELRQRWDRRPEGPRMIALQAVPGPNRLIEELDGLAALESLPPTSDAGSDLKRLFASWTGEATRMVAVRERAPAGGDAQARPGKQTSAHLARLWASDEVERLRAGASGKPDAAIQLANSYQIVTPVSGAVVLETQQQYVDAGLRPVDPATVPTIPEPETWAMLAVAAAVLAYAAYRRRTLSCAA